MGDILGIGTTHYPPGLVPEHLKPWPLAKMLHTDPRIPERMRDPRNWPVEMRAEWGDDEGVASFCVLSYDTLTFQPFARLGRRPNIWGEPGDKTFTWPGHPRAGRHLAGAL